jgi:CDP-glycerol glycerophosphotransferase (TagB/SpsB family)
VLCSTHVYPAAPDLIAYYHLAQKGLRARGKKVFLQHGITINRQDWMHYPTLRVDMFACGAKMEYDFIHDNFGYPEGVVQYLGFCRFDHLRENYNPKREILVMPTWRGSYYPSGEAFKETQYYKYFQSLLNNRKIIELLERLDYKLIFYPHAEIQCELHKFSTSSDRVILADKESYDVQVLLKDCAMLVTDYSSVFFDVAYLRKPIIYYQFDKEEFRRYHYHQGYFEYERDGYGPVCETEEAVVNEICSIAENDFNMKDMYMNRINACFEMEDTDNCKRTYEAVCKLLQ